MGTGLVAAWRKYGRKAMDRYLHIKYRLLLKERDFTILCPNCIAGNIYHRLGLPFLTPTINCFTSQEEFLKVIRNPKHYFSQELRFIETNKPFPVAYLDDVVYNFNHDTDPEKCRNDWNRRRERIQWDNIYVIVYEENPMTREEIESLREIACKRLVVLTDRTEHIDLEYVKLMKRNYGRPNERHFLDRDELGVQTFEKQFNFVNWLNGKKNY